MLVDNIPKCDEYIVCDKKDRIVDVLKEVKRKGSAKKKINYVIPLENKKPIGIISFRDVALKLMNEKRPLGEIRAEDVMSTPIVTVNKDRDAEDTLKLMVKMGFRSLPVVDQKGELRGCVSLSDLSQNLVKSKKKGKK